MRKIEKRHSSNRKKTFHKPLDGYSVRRTFIWHFINPKTAKQSFKFIKEVWKNFFMIQQKQKFGRTHIPVANVEHPLDEKIPFTPEKVGIYLDFVGFFIRILSMIKKSLPKSMRCQKCNEFVAFLATLYHNAADVYSKTLTTTERPHYKHDFHFWVIYTFDPHFLCVPSLHIAIVTGSYAFIRNLFATSKTLLTDDEQERILGEIYNGALNIAESVLFIKQHSINCVAGALYMLTALFQEDFFSESDALNFADNLFKDNKEREQSRNEAISQNCKIHIEESDKTEIRNYIASLYKKLLAEKRSAPTTPWQKPILDFLEGYKATQELSPSLHSESMTRS